MLRKLCRQMDFAVTMMWTSAAGDLVMKFMDLTDEEALAIRWHMGAYDDAFRGGSRALNEAQDKCALVLALHHADMQATQEEKRREGIL